MVSGYLDNHGKRIDVLGTDPGGMVVFTEDLRFVVVVNNPDIPKFVSGDRNQFKIGQVSNALPKNGNKKLTQKFLITSKNGATFANSVR